MEVAQCPPPIQHKSPRTGTTSTHGPSRGQSRRQRADISDSGAQPQATQYDRLNGERVANGRRLKDEAAISVNELTAANVEFVQGYYQNDGKPTESTPRYSNCPWISLSAAVAAAASGDFRKRNRHNTRYSDLRPVTVAPIESPT